MIHLQLSVGLALRLLVRDLLIAEAVLARAAHGGRPLPLAVGRGGRPPAAAVQRRVVGSATRKRLRGTLHWHTWMSRGRLEASM